MAFLDNSGDIILDAVLTDTGRMRLAKGDGSFKIAKFALGDDEINYELFDKEEVTAKFLRRKRKLLIFFRRKRKLLVLVYFVRKACSITIKFLMTKR